MKELRCASCAHKIVCSIKEEFANAQDAVDRVTVPLDDNATISLNQIKWIKPVSLDCIHFLSDGKQREYPTNLCDALTATSTRDIAMPNVTYTVTG